MRVTISVEATAARVLAAADAADAAGLLLQAVAAGAVPPGTDTHTPLEVLAVELSRAIMGLDLLARRDRRLEMPVFRQLALEVLPRVLLGQVEARTLVIIATQLGTIASQLLALRHRRSAPPPALEGCPEGHLTCTRLPDEVRGRVADCMHCTTCQRTFVRYVGASGWMPAAEGSNTAGAEVPS